MRRVDSDFGIQDVHATKLTRIPVLRPTSSSEADVPTNDRTMNTLKVYGNVR